MRIDRYLVENKYFSSREKAIVAIKENKVFVDDKLINKPSFEIKKACKIYIKNDERVYVSRGGKKLEHAILKFNLNFKEKIILDIGSSTGGFSDCSLQFGAKKVCAIDVGTDQMDKNLAKNKKIFLKENFNLKDLTIDTFNESFDFIVTDVSFISLKHVFPVVDILSNENTNFITLIKPQFETENLYLNSNGVIKNKDVHLNVINKICSYALEHKFYLNKLDYSPIKGKKEGNIEFLALFTRKKILEEINISKIVNDAHLALNK